MRLRRPVAAVPPSSPTAGRAANGRTLFVAGAAVFALLVATLAATDRWRLVEVVGVPSLAPAFADVRSITGAHVALANRVDPFVANPGDPWQRPFNYPRVWLLPAELGARAEHTAAIAATLFLAFGVGVATLAPLATTPLTALALLLVLFAPTTWLAIERANNDLLTFGLLATAALLALRRRALAAGCVTVAAALKLFPIFGLAGLLDEPNRRARRTVLVTGALFLGYLAWIRDDLPAIRANAQTWHPISYGITLLPRAVADRLGWSFAWLLGAAALAFTAVGAFAIRARRRARLGAASSAHSLAAFRIGATVFVGTFLLGSNFDYRLIVLLLVVPQLVAWSRSPDEAVRREARTRLVVLMLVVWSMTWRAALTALGAGREAGLVVDELLSWSLAGALGVSLVASLPDWLLPASFRERPWRDGANETTGAPAR